MKHTTRHLRRIACFIAIIFLLIAPFQVQAKSNAFSVNAKAALVVDANSGKILYNQNGDEVLGIASMTKLLSAYLIYEQIELGTISLSDPLPISDYLVKLSQDPDLSNIPIEKEHAYTVEDALAASLISSANSLTSALAEYVAGSEVAFVQMMYDKLDEWGIHDALLVSASGLSNEYIQAPYYGQTKKLDENMMSAKDIAIVARHLLEDYPEVLNFTSLPSMTLFENSKDPLTIWNSNNMLPGYDYFMEGVDGLKTGTSPVDGACFIGTLKQDNTRLITVVMGVDDKEYNRFDETTRMINYVNSTWQHKTLMTKGEAPTVPTVDVKGSKYKKADLALSQDVTVWTHPEDTIEMTLDLTTKQVSSSGKIKAPMSKKTVVAHQYVTNKSDTLGYLTPEDKQKNYVPVTLKNDLEKDNIFLQAWYLVSGKA